MDTEFQNYYCVSKHDRADIENRGGIITLARHDVGNFFFLENSVVAERA